MSSTNNQVIIGSTTGTVSQTVTIEQERAPSFRLLDQIKDVLRRDPILNDFERQDLLSDVQMVEQQLKRREPNRAVLAALLEPLSRVASIGGFVTDLIRLFNNP